mgnify:CR=1 FL=1
MKAANSLQKPPVEVDERVVAHRRQAQEADEGIAAEQSDRGRRSDLRHLGVVATDRIPAVEVPDAHMVMLEFLHDRRVVRGWR